MENPWKTHSEQEIYDNPWINVTEYQVTNPGGNPGIYGKVHIKGIALGVIPIDEEGYTYLVGQYRYTLDEYSWEIPEGGGSFSKTPEEEILRELKEETGIEAEQLTEIARCHTSNSITDELGIMYIATGLTQGEAQPDDDEQIAVRRLTVSEAIEMVLTGEITDAISMIALMKLKSMIIKNEVDFMIK